MEEAGADWRRGQMSSLQAGFWCHPGYSVRGGQHKTASALTDLTLCPPWTSLPCRSFVPCARLSERSTGQGETTMGRAFHNWKSPGLCHRPLRAISFQAQGVERWCRNHFPALDPLAWVSSWLCREHWPTWYLTPWVLTSGLILAHWVSSDSYLLFCITLPLRVVQPN